jgi:hypothetical protein
MGRNVSNDQSVNASELQGTAISTTAPSSNQVLTYNGTDWAGSSTVNATELQGTAISTTAPTLNQASVPFGSTNSR